MRSISLAGVSGASVSVIFNAILGPRFGAAGTAVALAVGQVLAALLLLMITPRHIRLTTDWHTTIALLAAAAAVSIASTMFGAVPLAARLMLGTGFVVVCARLGALSGALGLVRGIAHRN